jgi:hypothetical protein
MDSTQESSRPPYRITVRYTRISKQDAELKKQAIIGVLTEAVRRRQAVTPSAGEGV